MDSYFIFITKINQEKYEVIFKTKSNVSILIGQSYCLVDILDDAGDLRKYLLSWKSQPSVGKDSNMLFINIAIFSDFRIRMGFR